MATRNSSTNKNKVTNTNTQTKAKTETTNDKLKKENAELRNRLEEIENKLASLAPASPDVKKQEIVSETSEEDEYIEIPLHKQIRVMNLCYGKLVLSTEGYGQGRVYEFERFASVRLIPYQDLVAIINMQQSFAESGAFYILDNQVVKNCGLESFYTNIMDKKKIETILTVDDENFSRIINNASKIQLETISARVTEMLRNHEYVDYNKVNILNQKLGRKIEDLIA